MWQFPRHHYTCTTNHKHRRQKCIISIKYRKQSMELSIGWFRKDKQKVLHFKCFNTYFESLFLCNMHSPCNITCSEIYLLVFTCIIPKYDMCLINNLSEYLANFAAVSPHLVDTSTKGESVVMLELVPSWSPHCHGRAGPSWTQLLMPHLWRIIWAGCHPELPSATITR